MQNTNKFVSLFHQVKQLNFYIIEEEIFTTTDEKITQSYRDTLMHFNLRRGHSWYDVQNNKLYDEYGYLRVINAKSYLLSIGAIDENNNRLYFFQY